MAETLGPAPAQRDKRGIQSILLAFRIVESVRAASAPMTLSAISRAVSMVPSKVTLYLNSLCSVGLLVKSDDLRYQLGRYALDLGLAALHASDALTAAREEMPRLRTQSVLAVYLSVWGSQGPVIVGKDDQHPMLPLTIRLGHVLPLCTSATGNVFLAYLPQEVTAAALRREQPAQVLEATALARIRKAGVAWARGHVNTGVVATAAPIFDREGALAAVLTVLTPVQGARLRDAQAESLLLDTVRRIGEKVGSARGGSKH